MRPIWMPVSVSYSFFVIGPISVHAAREADLIAVIHDLADRGDNSCGTAKTTLCEILYLIEVNLTLLDFQSEVILCYYEQRTTGDGRQDAVGLRSNDLIVLCYEQEVSSAGLLDLRSGSCIEVHILIITLTLCASTIAYRLIA